LFSKRILYNFKGNETAKTELRYSNQMDLIGKETKIHSKTITSISLKLDSSDNMVHLFFFFIDHPLKSSYRFNSMS